MCRVTFSVLFVKTFNSLEGERMEYIFYAVALLVVGVVLFFILKKKEDNSSAESSKNPVEQDPIDDLLLLNLEMRKSYMPPEWVGVTEEVIDLLVELMPLVKEQESASGELSWTVNRIATEYLPNKCVRPFIKLDEVSQNDRANISSYSDSIGTLKVELLSVKEMVSSRDVRQFNAKAKFLKNRFDNTGV